MDLDKELISKKLFLESNVWSIGYTLQSICNKRNSYYFLINYDTEHQNSFN